MAVPSRVYVGVLVFGLIACLVTVPYTAIVLAGYSPPDDSPLVFFDPPKDAGKQAFLVLASIFSIGFTIAAWRALLTGARDDARRRRARRDAIAETRRYIEEERRRRQPPGYT